MILAEVFATITFLNSSFLVKKIMSEMSSKVEGVIVVFGSFAKGEETEGSDVDFLILTEKEVDPNLMVEVSTLVGREINVKYTDKNQFLRGLENNDP